MSNPWDTRASWDEPSWNLDQVAEFLGATANNVRQMLSRRTVPQPDDQDGRRHMWSPATVYRHTLQHRPQLAGRIPRLFPRIPSPTPAAFLDALTVAVPGTGPVYV